MNYFTHLRFFKKFISRLILIQFKVILYHSIALEVHYNIGFECVDVGLNT